ncbi:MAG: hypothetical protein H6733_16845 [Alphaproteobacteria bacterium]|nr:hypothetical protein [Alphaproteobacteria bacterium]
MTTAELPWARLRDELARWFRRRADDEALAEDLAHEVLARLVDHAPRLRSVASVGPWVHRVAGSVWVDHLRRTRPVGEIDLASVAAPTGDPEPVGGPLGAWTLAALASLPPGQAEAVRLVDVDGVSRAEAAARLGLTVKGLNSRVQRGRVALRQALTRCCEVALDARGGLVAWRARSGCCEG